MRILTIILLLFAVTASAQVEYQPEEMFVQNRFGIPYRDTTGSGQLGEVRCRPQDNKYYGWAGDILRWQQLGSGTSGSASFTATPPLIYSSNVLSMPRASATDSGYISTGTQSIAGLKTFVSAGLNVQPTSTNTTGYYQINNNAGNFQFALTQSTGYSAYGVFQANTGGFYTSASNGMAALLDNGGTFKVGFGSSTTPGFEVGASLVSTRAASSLLQQAANTLSFTGASSHTVLSSISPSGFAAVVRTLSDAGIDCRMQSTTTDAFMGTVTNHDLSIVSNNSTRISLPAAGGIGFTLGSDATGDIFYRNGSGFFTRLPIGTANQQLRVNAGATAPEWFTPSGSGITSINSQTGSSQTIASGTAIIVNSSTNTHTISVDPTSSVFSRGLQTFTTDVNNTGTSETDLYSYTVPGGALTATGNLIRFEYAGQFNDNTATATLRVYFAGSQIGNTAALTVSAVGAWEVRGYVMRTGTTTARTYVTFLSGSTTLMTVVQQADLTSKDFTTTNILKITGTAGGAGGGNDDITAKTGKISFEP